MAGIPGDPHTAQADGDPSEAADGVLDWYLRGRIDATEGRFDPPADPGDRLTYEAGHASIKDITP
jgi:hypothetical protein